MAYPFDHPMFAKSIQPTDQASTISRSEQLHQWSIYRQQLNAALTQSALTAGCLPSSDVTSGRPFDLKSKHARKPPIETAANQLSVDALDYFHLALPRVRAPSSGDLYRSVTSSRTSSSKSHTLRHHYNPHSHLQHLPPHLQAPSRYQQQDARKQHHVSSSSFSSASSSSNRRSMHPLLHPHHPHHHPHHHLQQKQLFLLPPAQDFQQSYVREHNLHYNHHLQLSSASSSHLIRHSEQQLPDLHLNTRTDPFPTAELNCELKSGGQASANDTNCDSERNNSLHPSTLPHSASKQELVRANRNNEKANSSKVTLAQLIDSKSQQSENEMPKHGEPKRLLEKSCLNNRHTLISARLRRSMLDLGTTDDRKAPEFKHQRALSVDELRSRPIDASCQPINTLRSDSTAQPSVASSESGPNQTTIDSEYHRTPLTSEQSSLKRLGSVFSEEIDGSGGPLLSSNPSFDKSSNSGTQLESVTCNSSAIDCSRAKQYKTQLLVRSMYFEYDCTSNPGLLCGGARQKVRVLDHINFELLAGQMILLMATNG